MDLESLVDGIDWWLYVIVVCMLFFIILALSYCVKKLNETRMDQADIKAENKTTNQPVQFQDKEIRPSIRTPPDSPDNLAKISLVFDKERKVRMSEAVIEKSESFLAHQSATLSDNNSQPAKSIDNAEEPKPTFLGEIYQNQRKDTEIETIVCDKLKSNEKPGTVEETAHIPNKCCEAAAKLIEKSTQEQIKDAISNIVKISNDDDKSSKVEQNKPKIDKVEQKKNINDKIKICKTCSDNSKVGQNKPNIAKAEQNENINDVTKICKTCNDKNKSSKAEENKPKIDRVEQIQPKIDKFEQIKPNIDKVKQNILDKNVKKETCRMGTAKRSSEMEQNQEKVEKNKDSHKDKRPKTSDSDSDDTESRKPGV